MSRINYKTQQKNKIVEFFKENEGGLFSAKEILDYLKDEKIGLTTVYRLIDSLIKDSTLIIFYGEFGKKYGYFPCNNNKHYNLICTKCGKISHIECDTLMEIANHLSLKHNFKLESNEIFLKGRCELCQ